jgi:hypothetical protein
MRLEEAARQLARDRVLNDPTDDAIILAAAELALDQSRRFTVSVTGWNADDEVYTDEVTVTASSRDEAIAVAWPILQAHGMVAIGDLNYCE